MKSVELSLEKEILWPMKCAICNQEAKVYAFTNHRVIDGFYIVAIRESTLRIAYPVCKKHKWTARFYDVVTNQSFATGFVMAIAFPFLLCIPILVLDPKSQGTVVKAIFVGFTFGIFYWKFRNPVKIVRVKKGLAKFRFGNERYAEEFEKANSIDRPGEVYFSSYRMEPVSSVESD
jgi:hypothetical protein